jgi:RNA polymerase sigma-70 factor (ECF subfamily)
VAVADGELVARLRDGDEGAFVLLVERYHTPLLRLATTMLPSRAVAEEVVQDTWLGVLRGLDGFEGRSSLKTWLFRILLNRARTAGAREVRAGTPARDEPAVEPTRFGPGGAWAEPPVPWVDESDERLDAQRLAAVVRAHLDQLPDGQRQVVVLRDVEGLGGAEVCDLLGITEGNQRVLLHRGRARLRAIVERELGKV